MSSLPEGILEEIFLRLQVKELLRCRCVCKTWCTLIHTSNFIYKHLNLSIKEYNCRLMFQYGRPGNRLVDAFCTIDYNSLLSSLASSSTETYECDEAVEIDYPLISADNTHYIEILGSCNGLLCVLTNYPRCSDEEDAISLWNPSTNEYKEIPASPNHYTDETGLYGFGYDYKTDDYKVVRVVDYFEDFNDSDYSDTGSDVEVYSLQSNSWKNIDCVQYYFPSHRRLGVVVNGALHWLGVKTEGQDVIISFDISSETFTDLALVERPPPHLPGSDSCYDTYSLGVLGGCLCLVSKLYEVEVDVWVMQAYGDNESWTKRFSINQENIINNLCLTLMWDFKNGEILLEGDDFLVHYDSNRKRATKLRIRGDAHFSGAANFVPSLVSLNSGDYVRRWMLE